jgi:predicted RNase H-like HicB family nuclease
MNFIAVVYHEEGSAAGVHFPDVPGCFAAADDPADIMQNAISALDDFFADSSEVTEARGIEAIRLETKEDLAEGAYLMAVPHIPNLSKIERVNISLERGLLNAIDNHVKLAGFKTRSEFFAVAATNEIKLNRESA